MYHKISTEKRDFLSVHVDDFKRQMNYISTKFDVVPMKLLIDHLDKKSDLPENAAIISFDDGYEDNFTLAYPVLKKLNLPFTIFLVSDFIGKKVLHDGFEQQFLSIEQLKEMSDLANYGGHSLKHDSLMDLAPSQWENEITLTMKNLGETGLEIQKAWAYTYGAFPKKDENRMAILKTIFNDSDIKCAFRIGNRTNKIPLRDQFRIERIDIRGDESYFKFKMKAIFGKFF